VNAIIHAAWIVVKWEIDRSCARQRYLYQHAGTVEQ
jgi:hypothetical protein